jgi:hypothetical protein
MRDIDLLKTDPTALFEKYMSILMSGGVLTETELIMLETVKNILGK